MPILSTSVKSSYNSTVVYNDPTMFEDIPEFNTTIFNTNDPVPDGNFWDQWTVVRLVLGGISALILVCCLLIWGSKLYERFRRQDQQNRMAGN